MVQYPPPSVGALNSSVSLTGFFSVDLGVLGGITDLRRRRPVSGFGLGGEPLDEGVDHAASIDRGDTASSGRALRPRRVP